MSRNSLKLPKNLKNRNSDRYSSIKNDFSTQFLAFKMCDLDNFWQKNGQKCHILGASLNFRSMAWARYESKKSKITQNRFLGT